MSRRGLIARHGLAPLAALLIAACGGGDGFQVAGISGTGVTAAGAVTAATPGSSVTVNGVEYDTSDAAIDAGLTGLPLRVGQVVTVTGTLDDESSGAAETVVFDRMLDGPVEMIDVQASTITALNQTIQITDSTAFFEEGDPSFDGLEDLSADLPTDLIAVSGFTADDGELVATYIELGDPSFELGTRTDLEGTVSNLDSVNNTFDLGGLTVDFTGLSTMDGGVPEEGARVEVFGTQSELGGVFDAEILSVLDPTIAEPGTRVELEGIVSGFDETAGTFTLQGQPVDASDTEQPDGLANGDRVEVEGTIDDDGVLAAEAVIQP